MSLMRNNKTTVIAVGVFVLLFLGALATRCSAQDAVTFAVGSAVARGETLAVDLGWRFKANGDANWQVNLTLIGDSTYDDVYQPNNAALQVLYVDGFGPVDLGLGVAVLQNTDRYNGSRGNFTLLLRYRWQRVFAEYRHWSNAGTVKPNLGRDVLYLGWTF